MKVHVFASDVLPYPGLPTSGGGLRSWQLIRGLRANGLTVTASMPREVFLGKLFADRISAADREQAWDFTNQARILENLRPDVAIWCNCPTIRLPENWSGPTRLLADLHGPVNIESVHVTGNALAETTAELVSLLCRYDGFSCVSPRQRFYWAGLLAAAGILIDDLPFVDTPLVVEPAPAARDFPEELRLIYAGGFYPWQNCIAVLDRIGAVLSREGGGRLDIFGGVHEFSDRPEFRELFERLSRYPAVHQHGFVSRDELMKYYRQASCAVDLMERNIERELAVTTRTVEYLAFGIPPIYNNYNHLSALVSEHDAGWCLDPGDLDGVEALVRELLRSHRAIVPAKAERARGIFQGPLSLDGSTRALATLCRNIRKRPVPPAPGSGSAGLPAPPPRKPFHKRFYYAWQALRGKRMKVLS